MLKDIEIIKELYSIEPFLTTAGIFYGFPICCISSFIKKSRTKKKLRDDLASFGTGYIPCENCAIHVKNDWESVLLQINESRISTLAFPNDDNSTELNKFFISLSTELGFNAREQAIQLRVHDDIILILDEMENDRH